ncbi:flagellar hook-associated protein FlgK [Candidatus Symbiopectobacterium sp. 'North America']|uniref:flagellar hook-associated protein FlgK n=1 Tax=Candidatus Symbiopectobacterium sp. 'North America' TaxID=2794574 RepID=UPI0018C8EC8A|nr:flagellar hook-associated protein FlgK [Candidatus Symbiopectobacterium sp. 'North America']MBG6245376.1 flagellar hook-associated protein FlgK [Candidatus Symbiopectobacterium sp. 'North America']
MFNLVNTAMSGLKAAQAALSAVSNNISNQAVTGYSRQTALIEQATGTSTGGVYIGNGVNLVSINRDYNKFIASQLLSAQATSSSVTTSYEQISKIDNLLASSTTNLSTSMQEFFTNLQNVANNAGDSSARQTMIGKAQGLVNQFQVTDKYLRDMESSINSEIKSVVGQVNTYISQIANLNKEITCLQGANQGAQPNDLLDQRDLLVDKLNKLVGVNVTIQDGSIYNVSLKNGMNLVHSTRSFDLVTIPSSSDPQLVAVGYDYPTVGVSELRDSTLSGGKLGGLISFRTDTLDTTRNQVNQLVLAFADAFNTQHKAGYDYNGVSGDDFFQFGGPVVYENSKNTGNAVLNATYTDTKSVQATDYSMRFNSTSWDITRTATNTTITGLTPDANGKLSFDGLEVTITDGATPTAAGDTYLLKPVSDVIIDMKVAISDPNKVAAASTKLDENGNEVPGESGGPSDNTNAKALLALQNEKIVGNTATFTGAYASILGDIGNQTNTLKINSTIQKNVVTQLTAQQQSVSGVNLDEEYGDLMRYQQYYMANAKVIQTAQALFDALLSIRS